MKSRGDLRDAGLANQEVAGQCHWVMERHTLQAKPSQAKRTLPKSVARNPEPPAATSATTLRRWPKNEANADGSTAEVVGDGSCVCI